MSIHPTAIIDKTVEIGSGVEIGPYCIIEPRVIIGSDSRLISHVFIDEGSVIGNNCVIFPFSSIGTEPQDNNYMGETSWVEVGDGVLIREFVTINRATGSGEATSIGDESRLMAYVHVAHNSRVGRRVSIINNPFMAGYVTIEDGATVSSMAGLHQFVRIGTMAHVGGLCKLIKDAPPYMIYDGQTDFHVLGPNLPVLRENGISDSAISALEDAYEIIFKSSKPLKDALAEAESALSDTPEVMRLITFFSESKRGVYRRP